MAKVKARRGYSSVTLKCSNLENAIREAINKPKGAISRKDIASLDSLKASSVNDLTGLECATNLAKLELAYASRGDDMEDEEATVDLTPLEKLTKLIVLDLDDSSIADLTPLAGLTQLSSLSFRDADLIYDITPLSRLANLTKLDLYYNQVTDLTPLSGLTNLTELNLFLNDITDLTPLSRLTNLTKLNLCKNQKITDITPLAGLTNLIVLDLSYTSITDIAPLSGLTNLTELNLFLNDITDLTPLSRLTNLTKLNHEDFNAIVIDKDNLEDINHRFIEAAKSGDADVVRDLITQEADLRSTDENGTTAWELAATAGHNAVVKVLKDAVSDLGELLADPESGDSQRAPCPVCGVFDDVMDPTCGHFVGATYGGSTEESTAPFALDDIVFDVSAAVEGYLDQGAAQLSSKWNQKGRKKGKKDAGEEFTKTIMQSVPKSLAPAIESMGDYGNEWWTRGSGIKEGVSVGIDEFMNSNEHQGFYHSNVTLFARRQKDKALKVLKWLEKQGYVPDH